MLAERHFQDGSVHRQCDSTVEGGESVTASLLRCRRLLPLQAVAPLYAKSLGERTARTLVFQKTDFQQKTVFQKTVFQKTVLRKTVFQKTVFQITVFHFAFVL